MYDNSVITQQQRRINKINLNHEGKELPEGFHPLGVEGRRNKRSIWPHTSKIPHCHHSLPRRSRKKPKIFNS